MDVGSNGFSSDAHIFNHSKLKNKIEDGSLIHAFRLMSWLVKPYSRNHLIMEERIANYRISRSRRAVENAFGILASRFNVLLGTMQQTPKFVRDIVLTCVVLHNMLRTHQRRLLKAPTPIEGIAITANELAINVPGENHNYHNELPWEQKKLASISAFQDYPIIPTTFI